MPTDFGDPSGRDNSIRRSISKGSYLQSWPIARSLRSVGALWHFQVRCGRPADLWIWDPGTARRIDRPGSDSGIRNSDRDVFSYFPIRLVPESLRCTNNDMAVGIIENIARFVDPGNLCCVCYFCSAQTSGMLCQ